jgi:hypothetical protein
MSDSAAGFDLRGQYRVFSPSLAPEIAGRSTEFGEVHFLLLAAGEEGPLSHLRSAVLLLTLLPVLTAGTCVHVAEVEPNNTIAEAFQNNCIHPDSAQAGDVFVATGFVKGDDGHDFWYYDGPVTGQSSFTVSFDVAAGTKYRARIIEVPEGNLNSIIVHYNELLTVSTSATVPIALDLNAVGSGVAIDIVSEMTDRVDYEFNFAR